MMQPLNDKPTLRQHYRVVRDAIPAAERNQRSAEIARLVLATDVVARAGSVFCYASSGSEVGTLTLIDELLRQGKTVAVPRISGGAGVMRPVVIRSLDDLAPGRFGIAEPATQNWFDLTPDVTFVPGLAFTRTGTRLGMGGGYYDRYLARHPATYKIGLCFDPQLAGVLPHEAHDITMDQVIVA